MADVKESLVDIWKSALEKWGDKKWFQVFSILFFVYIVITPIIGPIVYNYISKSNTSEVITTTLDDRDATEKERHKDDFMLAKQYYATAKQTLKKYIEPTNCEYIFYIEYHNGVENVMSGIQFCRFDVTLEVTDEHKNFVQLDKFKDDIVARYDLLLSDEFNNTSDIFVFDMEGLYKADRYLYQQIITMDAKSIAFINIQNENGAICGTLLFVSTEKDIDKTQVYKCRREIENIFKNNIQANVD